MLVSNIRCEASHYCAGIVLKNALKRTITTVGLILYVMVQGLDRVNIAFNLTFIGWNLRRMGNIQWRRA